jgi:hypothetical protein
MWLWAVQARERIPTGQVFFTICRRPSRPSSNALSFRSQSCTNTEDVCCPADSVPGRYLENVSLVRSDRCTNLAAVGSATLPSAEALPVCFSMGSTSTHRASVGRTLASHQAKFHVKVATVMEFDHFHMQGLNPEWCRDSRQDSPD